MTDERTQDRDNAYAATVRENRELRAQLEQAQAALVNIAKAERPHALVLSDLYDRAETAEAALIDGQTAYEALGLRAEAAEAERDTAVRELTLAIQRNAEIARDLVNIAKAAQPMAQHPWPLSSDERREWITDQNRLRDALAAIEGAQ